MCKWSKTQKNINQNHKNLNSKNNLKEKIILEIVAKLHKL